MLHLLADVIQVVEDFDRLGVESLGVAVVVGWNNPAERQSGADQQTRAEMIE